MKNINKKQEKLKHLGFQEKFAAIAEVLKVEPQTQAVVRTFVNIESAFKIKRPWARLLHIAPINGIELIFEIRLLPLFQEKIDSLKDILDLTGKTLTLKSFHKICQTRNILVSRHERPRVKKDDLGLYQIIPATGQQLIWIKPKLTPQQSLFVAAHELAHYLLHRETLLQGKAISHLAVATFGKNIEAKDCYAELEADLFASMLITKQVEAGGRGK